MRHVRSYLYSSGTPLTKYTYTGQYSYVGDFGLHFYREASRVTKWRVDNARWYDSSLGRFAQADTILPLQQGVQAWDRYAYVNNNPINYTDPTGHARCDEDGNCNDGSTIHVEDYTHNYKDEDGCHGRLCSPAQEDNCEDWAICITDLTSDDVNDYWEFNNNFINVYGAQSDFHAAGGLFEFLAGALVKVTGKSYITKNLIALIFGGGALVEPSIVGEVLWTAAFISEFKAFALDNAMDNLQEINNNIERSGVKDNVGTITATLSEVVVTTPNGVPRPTQSYLIGWLSVKLWADNNSNLTTIP